MRDGRQHNLCLIADDDLFIRKVLAKHLDGLSESVQAVDGGDCLKLYKEHKPDVAFLDIHLPILTGLELIDQLLRLDPTAYIIVMSADSTAENVQAALRAGAKGFLSKPIQRDRLMHYLNTCPTMRFADPQSKQA